MQTSVHFQLLSKFPWKKDVLIIALLSEQLSRHLHLHLRGRYTAPTLPTLIHDWVFTKLRRKLSSFNEHKRKQLKTWSERSNDKLSF